MTDEPLKLTPETLPATTGTETSLPERPKETVTDTSDVHAKRPYESSLTAKDDELPHKIAKVDDTVAAAGATSGHVAETGSLARKPGVPAETGSVQPQIVPGLGADPNDNVSTVLNVPGLSPIEEKSTVPSAAEASAVPAPNTSTEPKGAEDIAPTGAPTSDANADATEKSKDSEISKAEEETVATEPKGAEDIAPTGAPTSAGNVDVAEQPKDTELSKAEETVASEPPTTAAPAVASEPEAPSTTELTTAAAPSEVTGTETVSPSGATAPSATDSTTKAASASADTGTGTATSAPAPPAEPVLKVPSSIHDGPDSKVTSANKSAADQAVSNVEQEAEGASANTQAPVTETIPEETKPAAEVQEGTGAVKNQVPENQPTAREAQEAGAGAAKQPEEIQKPEEAKTKEPRAVQDAQEEGAATVKKPEELKPEDIKKPEEAKTKEPQAAQAAPADATSKPEGKETVKTEAGKAQDQAQESAKAEAAKLEKRKSGFFGWFKRKLKGEKA